jgi:hypothetical protein
METPWERISPANHEDLRNFDSVAFPIRTTKIIYAGTYHLPWKTMDRGKWSPVVKGMIDDSDVMSIVVDPARSFEHARQLAPYLSQRRCRAELKRYSGIPFVTAAHN